MPRYHSRAKRLADRERLPRRSLAPDGRALAYYEADDDPLLPSLNVDYSGAEPTGLIDQHGNEIVKLPERMGFIDADEA